MSTLEALPKEIVLKIISFLTYDEISKIRSVCGFINTLCMKALSSGFLKVEAFHSEITKEIKGKLPKRESERRNHNLCRHSDILSAIETRLSLLQITYSKYIDSGYCCFIPGKVLDELYSVLRRVRKENTPPRAHELLMELRDVSSMAMEHFEENILPILKKKMVSDGISVLPGGLTVSLDSSGIRSQNLLVKRPLCDPSSHYSQACKRRRLSSSHTEERVHLSNATDDFVTVNERLDEAERIISMQGQLIEEQSRSIEALNRKLVSISTRFSSLTEILKEQFSVGDIHDHLNELYEASDLSQDIMTPDSSPTKTGSAITSPSDEAIIWEKKPAIIKVKHLKEQMDLFKDEMKLD